MRFVSAIVFLITTVIVPFASVRADTTGSVRGFVRFGYGVPSGGFPRLLEEAEVTFSGPNGEFTSHVNKAGFYVIFGITPGKYRISAHIPGWAFNLQPPIQHLCIHAGENLYQNLLIGITDLPIRSALERLDYLRQFRPDASQTADVYSIGDC